MMFESLESRRLMSVSLNSLTGLLTVIGKNDANPANGDVIKAQVIGATMKVVDNNVTHFFNAAKVKKIAVYAQAGDDQVTIDPSVSVPTYLDSGASTFNGDKIKGGSGPDTILLRGSFSIANGGAGNDTLENHGGVNVLYGDAGNDKLINKHTISTESGFHGGAGIDTVDYSAATMNMILRNGGSGEYFLAGSTPVLAGPGADGVSGMENLTSGSGNDYVYGNAANNILRGNGGKDQLRGGDGNDTLHGGAGADAMFGEGGNDTFYSKGDFASDFLSGGLGWDTANRDAIDVINSVEGSF